MSILGWYVEKRYFRLSLSTATDGPWTPEEVDTLGRGLVRAIRESNMVGEAEAVAMLATGVPLDKAAVDVVAWAYNLCSMAPEWSCSGPC